MDERRFWTHWGLCCGLVAACGSAAGTPSPLSVAHETFNIKRVEKVDLLFVIDNSNSMAGEQALLRARLPDLMRVLTRGERVPDDPAPFTPVRDLHVGVVSTDMGTPGVEFPSANCHADGGDDGRLLHAPHPDPVTNLQCAASYPTFVSFQAGQDTQQLATDFACIAGLGTGGCGYESPLEAAFKALWPKNYVEARPNGDPNNPYRFIAIDEEGTWGRGDQPAAQGGNGGFLRNDPDDPSLIVVVVVTDEEDCSVSNTDPLKPNNQLPLESPYREQDTNLRCYYNKQFQYSLDRYLTGLRKLRPGREDLVVFSAIAGVPADLVAREVLDGVDFSDSNSRNDFFADILNDPRMQEMVDPSTMPGSGQGNLKPSCIRVGGTPDGTVSTAYPPRRLVELAQAFGENGMVQSICQDDFAPALDNIVGTMAKPLREMCMTQKLVREDDGKVQCTMYWELPPVGQAAPDLPVDCAELGDIVDADVASTPIEGGGQRCAIRQLAVKDAQPEAGRGWYYDDATPGLDHLCSGGLSRRIAFSADVRAPQGVSVRVECQGEAAAK